MDIDHKKEPLVFDDEPLEGLLYGQSAIGPTPVDCFLPIKAHMLSIRTAYRDRDKEALISSLITIVREDMALPKPICEEIIRYMEFLIPNVPLPQLSHDIVHLTPLLENIWALPYSTHEYGLQCAAGDRLYRCYEHQQRYSDACAVLANQIHLAQGRGDQISESIYTNNLAFEFLFEKRYEDAMPLFQRSQKLFFGKGDDFSAANSRANFLTCVFSLRPACELTEYDEELKDLAQTLSRNNDWRARKPYVLLSGIRESFGDLDGAISYMRNAIHASENANLKWTEIDKRRLSELERRR